MCGYTVHRQLIYGLIRRCARNRIVRYRNGAWSRIMKNVRYVIAAIRQWSAAAIALFLLLSAAPFARSQAGISWRCATPLVTLYQQGLGGQSPEEQLLAQSLVQTPRSAGYLQSNRYPLRIHYADEAFLDMAEQVLGIVEESWEIQVEEMGFAAPPPDCGRDGSDDLDVYIEDLPAGIGGYAAFACYIDETPHTDAASFIALASTLNERNIRGAVTHEFNHVCQHAEDYWETIVFKENTATWIEDHIYPDEDYYFNYIRAYQRHPDWAINAFSSTSPYQYGGCIWLHFLEEYYEGQATDLVTSIWRRCRQNELFNEPDYLDVLAELLPELTDGMDNLAASFQEFLVWRYACGERDDGVHFGEGGAWRASGNVSIDTTVDLAALPFIGQPSKPPADYGVSYFELSGPVPEHGLAIEFEGDPSVTWAASLFLARDEPREYRVRQFDIDEGYGLLLLGPGIANSADRLVVAAVNLSSAAFDPDTVTGLPVDFTLAISAAPRPNQSGRSALWLCPTRPVAGSGDALGMNILIEHQGAPVTADLYIAVEAAGLFYFLSAEPAFPSFSAEPAPFPLPLTPDLFIDGQLIELPLPELTSGLALRWHAALNGPQGLLDYTSSRGNVVPQRRHFEEEL